LIQLLPHYYLVCGTGKQLVGNMDYYCQNGSSLSRAEKNSQSDFILSIPHIRLDNVINIARKAQGAISPAILFEYHALEIMRQAMPVFVNMIARNVEFADRLKNLSVSDFEDISLFLIYYSTYLTSPQKDFLRSLGVNSRRLINQCLDWRRKIILISTPQLGSLFYIAKGSRKLLLWST
jgi:hypothetical protein